MMKPALALENETRRSVAPDGPLSGQHAGMLLDILRDAGQVAYVWTLSENEFEWIGDTVSVLGVEPKRLTLASDFAGFIPPVSGACRSDAILGLANTDPDPGVDTGIGYHLTFPFRAVASAEPVWFEDSGRLFCSSDGRPYQARGLLRAVDTGTQAIDVQPAIESDALTGGMSRAILLERLTAVLGSSHRSKAGNGFLMASIDDLSRYNDLFGFDVTDQVIKNVMLRMKSDLRAGDLIGRYSGNKFGIVLHNCEESEMEIAARRIRTTIGSASVETAAGPISVSASIGGVAFPKHGSRVQTIVQHAQEALDTARSLGANNYVNYRPSDVQENQRQSNLRLTGEIQSALDEDRFLLALQPISDPVTYEPRFYECLLRTRLPDGSIESAGHLVSHAERLGLIDQIDSRVLDLAMEVLRENQEIKLSLNVSAAAAGETNWVSEFSSHMSRCPGGAERVIVEITESMAVADLDAAEKFTKRMKDIGCRVAIDDFGAGYSSFRNLKMLHVDMIKIDGSFVHGCHFKQRDQAFVRALLQLAQSLELETVAEWIEDEADARVLRQLGVDYIQGFIAGRPKTCARSASMQEPSVAS